MDHDVKTEEIDKASVLEVTSKELVEATILAIKTWKQEEPGVVSQALGTVLSPVTWIIRKIVPQAAIEGVISGMDWAAKQTTSSRGQGDLEDLASCNSNADSVINFHIALAVAEGSAAGFFGALSLPADVPAIILLALRLIRQVGVEYGYEGQTDDDRAFVLSVLSASGANSQGEKVEAIALSSMLMNKLAKETWKTMAVKAATNKLGVDAAIIGTKNLAKSLGINLTKRKALSAIPVVGAVVGGSANGWYIREVGVAAQRNFQERWLRDRNFLLDAEEAVQLNLDDKFDQV